MNDMQLSIPDLRAALTEISFPEGFLAAYDQLECMACGHGTETFLVARKDTAQLYVAKCYDKSVHRTVHESDILKGLRHEGLPLIADEFQNDQTVCIIREYIAGMALDQYICEHRPTVSRVIDLCVQLCDILTCLHSQKPPVIHRDVKPQNVIVRDDGTVALIDFEISRIYDAQAGADTQLIGTRYFAPPEQFGFSQTDARTDIYSLGVLLCWMLTGCVDAKAADIQDRSLAAVVRRCTAFAPEKRFASADAVKRALLKAQKNLTHGRARGLRLAVIAILCLCTGFGIGRFTAFFAFALPGSSVRFQEPLIEQAVRVQLGKNAGEPLSTEELAQVKAIYILGNEVALTRSTFDNGLSGARAHALRGDIQTLADLKLLPNLEEVMVAYQLLSDIEPIADMESLVSVNLMHTRISDITPLANLKAMLNLNLYDTNVQDATPLDSCPRLQSLDLGGTLVTSVERIGGRDTLTSLSLKRVLMDSLQGIEHFTRLKILELQEANIKDLSALAQCPSLENVVLSENMRPQMRQWADNSSFTITYP